MTRFSQLFLTWVLLSALGGCGPTKKAPPSCSQAPTPEGLVASWAAKTVAHMKGRTTVRYFINPRKRTVRVPIDGVSYDLPGVPLAAKDIRTAQRLLARLNKVISLNFVAEETASKSDLAIYAVCTPQYKDDYGLVTTHSNGKRLVMLLNICSEVYRKYKGSFGPMFLHELGHVLGLEHPFDASDGDCILSTEKFGPKSAHTGHTLMAYREAPGGTTDFYTATDVKALIKIWGPDTN